MTTIPAWIQRVFDRCESCALDDVDDQRRVALAIAEEMPACTRCERPLVEGFDCEGSPLVRSWCMACKEPIGEPHLADCDRIVDADNRALRELGRG